MTGFLLDTNVVSSLSPLARPTPAVAAWIRQRPDALWVAAISVAEIVSGIARLRRLGSVRRSGELASWLETFPHVYRDRIHSLDLEAGRFTGTLLDRARAKGFEPGFADLAIAGIAQRHGLAVATRNLRHFRPLGIDVVDPFQGDDGEGPSA